MHDCGGEESQTSPHVRSRQLGGGLPFHVVAFRLRPWPMAAGDGVVGAVVRKRNRDFAVPGALGEGGVQRLLNLI